VIGSILRVISGWMQRLGLRGQHRPSLASEVPGKYAPKFVRLGSTADLPSENQAREFAVGARMICVANVNGVITAMDNVCLHRGGPLGQGTISHGKLVCPWHGWEFDPKTGAACHNPAARLNVYPVRIEGNDVLIEI
jgi:nitrite reductase (NADH) small subunit